MTEAELKYMVNRFLGWRLPDDFCPDAGISFKRDFNENTPYPMKHQPIGTNLLNANQADAMVRYIVDGMAAALGESAPIVCDGMIPLPHNERKPSSVGDGRSPAIDPAEKAMGTEIARVIMGYARLATAEGHPRLAYALRDTAYDISAYLEPGSQHPPRDRGAQP